MSGQSETIVIDNGSRTLRCGFGGAEEPRWEFPSIIGRPLHPQAIIGGLNKDVYVGDDASEKIGVLSLTYPVQHGIVTNWDDMERIWNHALLAGLRVDPADHPILLTEAPQNPKANREKMIQILFEKFNVPSFYVGLQGVLALFSYGRVTGVTVDAGDGVVQAVPIYESSLLTPAVVRQNLAGSDLTGWLRKMLKKRGSVFAGSSEREVVRDMKEKLSYVALDFDAELRKAATSNDLNRPYFLPDGNQVVLGSERFRCPELLFRPYLRRFDVTGIGRGALDSMMGCNGEMDGLHKLVSNSILKCDLGARKELYANIVLSGGSTLITGFPERLNKEVVALAPPKTTVNVIAAAERKAVAWMGGSIVASLDHFPEMLITRKEYNQNGPGIVHRKCQ
jgi:actin